MKQKQQLQFRQGDVFLRRIRTIPPAATKRESGVLAYGEVTGHKHAVQDLDAAEVMVGPNGELYLRVIDEGGVTIRHEEHGPVAIPQGNYEIRIQREYSPEEIRNVVD